MNAKEMILRKLLSLEMNDENYRKVISFIDKELKWDEQRFDKEGRYNLLGLTELLSIVLIFISTFVYFNFQNVYTSMFATASFLLFTLSTFFFLIRISFVGDNVDPFVGVLFPSKFLRRRYLEKIKREKERNEKYDSEEFERLKNEYIKG